MNVVVTGAGGFVGRNLCVALGRRDDVALFPCDLATDPALLAHALAVADVVFHLAGVNRPEDPAEFETSNAGFTREVCRQLGAAGRRAKMVFASSIQAALDNTYGRSKLGAEQALGVWSPRIRARDRCVTV